MAPGRRRLAFLDAARGVAALAVVVSHTLEETSSRFARVNADWFNLGRFGVCAFFLVSGFVIPISLERGRSLGAFAVSRAFRLYPLYWASLALVLASPWWFDVRPEPFVADLPASALVGLTMAQELVGVPHAIELYYTLTVELVWYAGCATLFALGWLGRTEAVAWAAVAGLAVVGVAVPLLADVRVPFSTPFYGLTLLVGTAVARHHAGTLPTRRLGRLLAATAVVGAAGAWLAHVRYEVAAAEGGIGFAAAALPWVAAYAAFLGAYALREATWPAPALFLGRISYSLYLLHGLVLVAVLQADLPTLPSLALCAAGSVALATATFHLIEAPAQRLGHRLADRRPAAVVSGVADRRP